MAEPRCPVRLLITPVNHYKVWALGPAFLPLTGLSNITLTTLGHPTLDHLSQFRGAAGLAQPVATCCETDPPGHFAHLPTIAQLLDPPDAGSETYLFHQAIVFHEFTVQFYLDLAAFGLETILEAI